MPGLRTISGAPVVTLSGSPVQMLAADGKTWLTLNPVPKRTNLCTNPSFEAGSASGWGTNGCTGTAAQGQAKYGTWAIKCVVNSSTITALGPYVTTANAAVAAGDVIAGSMWLYSATAYTAISSLEFKDATGARVSLTGGPATAIPANTWTRVTVTGTAPAGTDRVTLTGYSTTVLPLNTVIYGDGALIEKSATIGTYFDGATPADVDYRYVWSSTANASTSLALP